MRHKILLAFVCALCIFGGLSVSADDPAKPMKNDEMRTLFRENPEAFRKLMRDRAEKQRAKDAAFWKEVDDLGKAYRETSDPAKKAELKEAIVEKVSSDYQKHVERSRARLDDLKKRVAFLEAEQLKREKAAPEAVAFRVGHVLAGTQPPPPPKMNKKRAGKTRDGKGNPASQKLEEPGK